MTRRTRPLQLRIGGHDPLSVAMSKLEHTMVEGVKAGSVLGIGSSLIIVKASLSVRSQGSEASAFPSPLSTDP